MKLRERIILNAFEKFGKYGIRRVTMDQIAHESGISKRTLYETFRDKHELIRDGIKYHSVIKHAEANETIRTSRNVIEAIYILVKSGEEMKQKLNPLFFEDIRKYYPEVHANISSQAKSRDYSLIRTLIKKGIDDGLFDEDLNVELVNHFFHEVMNILMNEEHFPKEQYSHEEILRNIVMPYLSGISTKKGNEQIRKYFEKEIKHKTT